jgi:uncharacterized protein YndB with AHSA1/START domain
MVWIVVIGVVLLGVLVLAASRPDQFRVERSAQLPAPPAVVMGHLHDFKAWKAWSPWEKMDPNMQRTHSGAAQGVGAVYAWTGNSKVGEGRMEVLTVEWPSRLVVQLNFIKPFTANNTAEFTLTASDTGTHVVWAMYGPSPFISKLMGLVFNMDKLVGKDFEAGLANLKAVLQTPPSAS